MNRVFHAASSLVLTFAFAGCSHGIHSVSGGLPSASVTPAGISSSAQVVKVTAQPVSIATNSSADALVTLSISPGYHINANPATFSYLIATEITADKSEGLTADKPVYPTAEKKKFQFADQPLAVYEGEAQIKLPLRAEANAAKGARSLPINIRIQACDSEKCFAPDAVKTTISVDVK